MYIKKPIITMLSERASNFLRGKWVKNNQRKISHVERASNFLRGKNKLCTFHGIKSTHNMWLNYF